MGKNSEKRGHVAIMSTGDPVKDAEELRQAELHGYRMENNICPNGCAQMIWDDPHTRHCPDCQFVGWCNTPYAGGSETKQ